MPSARARSISRRNWSMRGPWRSIHSSAALSGSLWLENFWPRAVSLGEALYYGVYGIIAGDSSPGLLNNALWTMKIEFFGSMLVFGFLALFGKLRHRWIAYLVLAVVSWDSYYLAFVLGIALCDFSATGWSPKALAWPAVVMLTVGGLWLGAAPIPGPTKTMYSGLGWPGSDPQVVFAFIHIIGAFMLLTAVIYSPALKTLFSSRPLRWLGRVSFSMYLLHVLVLGSFASYTFAILKASHGYLFSMVWTGLAYLVIVLILSDIYTRYVDEPAIRFASYMQRKIMPLKAPQARPETAREPDGQAVMARSVSIT